MDKALPVREIDDFLENLNIWRGKHEVHLSEDGKKVLGWRCACCDNVNKFKDCNKYGFPACKVCLTTLVDSEAKWKSENCYGKSVLAKNLCTMQPPFTEQTKNILAAKHDMLNRERKVHICDPLGVWHDNFVVKSAGNLYPRPYRVSDGVKYFLREDRHCNRCGYKGIYQAPGEGDYYHGPRLLCFSCNNVLTYPFIEPLTEKGEIIEDSLQ